MPAYLYEATNFAAETIKGEMEATGQQAVLDHLRRLGYTPLTVEEKSENWRHQFRHLQFSGSKKLSLNDVVFFTEELTIMLRAGLPLEKAMTVLISVVERPVIEKFLQKVLAQIRGGSSLADALATEDVDLPKGYIAMIRAGEAGGARVLETTLERLTENLKRRQKMNETIASAMLYPMLVLGMAVLSIILILLFVLPQFEPLFASAHDNLPFLTKMVMGAGYGLRHYGWLMPGLVVVAVAAVRRVSRTSDWTLKRDRWLLRLPKIGVVLLKAETAKFSNMLGVLLANSVTPVTAITIAAESFSNQVLAMAITRVVTRVKEGEFLSTALAKENIFPSLSLHMIKIGEETGQLDAMLLRTAEIYDRDVKRSLDRFMALLTPLTTIILGIVIATIIAAILSAILSVNDTVM